MSEFKPGDRVRVIDPGLMELNRIMGVSDATNNVGTVASVEDGQDIFDGSGSLLINFDEGGSAPYPIEDVRRV